MPKTLDIAVVGAGTMAQSVHLPVLRRRWDRFTVTALVDHSPRRRKEAAEVWGVPEESRYETTTELIDAVRARTAKVDAVVLATDGLHVQDVLTIVKRGIPVLVEPPLGYSEQEIRSLADFERMTGRRLVVLAYPQQYDDAVTTMAEHVRLKDLRMIDYEVLMPASQPLYSHAHVTSSSYDLPAAVRSERRSALQEAVVAGAGDGATQRDRDLYVKGLLTGVAHQLAVVEKAYGPVTQLVAVRHWPRGVIPGSIEILGELEGGTPVRLMWHYLPFSPEYSERIQLLSARRKVQVQLEPPSFPDRRATVSLREKDAGSVKETTSVSSTGSAEAMWEDFHRFVLKGGEPAVGTREALAEVALMREVLARIVEADGRTLEPEPEPEPEPEVEAETAAAGVAVETEPEPEVEAETAAAGVAVETEPEPEVLSGPDAATAEPESHTEQGSAAVPVTAAEANDEAEVGEAAPGRRERPGGATAVTTAGTTAASTGAAAPAHSGGPGLAASSADEQPAKPAPTEEVLPTEAHVAEAEAASGNDLPATETDMVGAELETASAGGVVPTEEDVAEAVAEAETVSAEQSLASEDPAHAEVTPPDFELEGAPEVRVPAPAVAEPDGSETGDARPGGSGPDDAGAHDAGAGAAMPQRADDVDTVVLGAESTPETDEDLPVIDPSRAVDDVDAWNLPIEQSPKRD